MRKQAKRSITMIVVNYRNIYKIKGRYYRNDINKYTKTNIEIYENIYSNIYIYIYISIHTTYTIIYQAYKNINQNTYKIYGGM